MPKISVIIPIYKVAAFIGRCTESLMSQTMKDVEYIFVDDATPDNSIEILKETLKRYPDREHQVMIIRHEQNKGLPAARNTGLAAATGDYVFHCDSDDYVEYDMLESLCQRAVESSADVVWCDWYLTFGQNERYMKQPDYSTASEALTGMLSGAMKYNVWNKLVRRSIYTENDIWFPAGHGMGEDMTIIRVMACADKVSYVPKAFYHYIKTNAEAFTNTVSERQLTDIRYNVDLTSSFLKKKFGKEIEESLAFFKLGVKYPFLFSGSKEQYLIWREWYPDANAYISKNHSISARARFIQQAAAKGQYWIVRLHYLVVYKLMYGVIYK